MSLPGPGGERELLVFLPGDQEQPAAKLADALIDALRLEPLAIGRDLLSGGCEIRLYYHPDTEASVTHYLNANNIQYSLDRW